MPKVSVIIPVYNTEKYLEKCLESVCNQTLSDIEIICINDCSTDNSREILNKYAADDERIKIINFPENRGAAAARNAGIDAATGEYIGFVDSDDYPDLDFYEKLYNRAKETGADVAKSAYKDAKTGAIDTKLNIKILECKTNFAFTFCSAIFKHTLISENKISFPDLTDMEDPVFAFSAALVANKIEIIDTTFINIVARNNSLTRRLPSLRQVSDKIKGLNNIVKKANASDINENSYCYVIAYWFATIIQDTLVNKNPDIEEFLFFEMAQIFNQIKYHNKFKQYLDSLFPNLFEHFEKNDFSYIYDKNYLKKLIDENEVISFDIFDTLLLRPFIRPVDLFALIEEKYNVNNFLADRRWAEKKARIIKKIKHKDIEDVIFDEIYHVLGDSYSNIKQIEMDMEEEFLQPNPEMVEIFEYAKYRNKKIIITSDMYLSSKFLKKVLVSKGFNNFDYLYVSNEFGKTKCSGKLFEHILSELNIAPDKMLHIGDNINSDVNVPHSLGINVYYYKQIKERFKLIFENSNLLKFSETLDDKERKVWDFIVGNYILSWHSHRYDKAYWQDFAYTIGGPLILAFMQSIIDIAKERKLSDLFFVARDGYVLNKVYDLIKTKEMPENHYIYASRKLKKLCINEDNNSMYSDKTAFEYRKYANSINVAGNNIGIVDTCAGAFSAQNLIETYFPQKQFVGIYLASKLNYKYNYINLSYDTNNNKRLGFAWDLVEFLLTSNEFPIEDFCDLKPVYRKDVTEDDLFYNKVFDQIYNGELSFIKDFKYFLDIDIKVSVELVFKYLKYWWENMSLTDKLMLAKIKHPTNTEQTLYKPITDYTSKLEQNNLLISKEVLNV